VTSFDVVVSAENNSYIEWQALLFHHSCLRQLGQPPIVVVHGDGELRDGFRLISSYGGRVQRAPNFRHIAANDYPVRNTPGTLSVVDSDANRVVLCDPDMIFLRDEQFDTGSEIAVERSTYLRVNSENRPTLALACEQLGVSVETLESDPSEANVPVVVAKHVRKRLAREWLACVDTILAQPQTEEFVKAVWWLTSMWGLVFALQRLRLRPAITALTVANERGASLPEDPHALPALVHYCYGDAIFDKRDFHGPADACARVWEVQPIAGAGLGGRIREEIASARAFYGFRAIDEFPAAAP
jgi:hypothetical protein